MVSSSSLNLPSPAPLLLSCAHSPLARVSTELLCAAIFPRNAMAVTGLPKCKGPDQRSPNVFLFMLVSITGNTLCGQVRVGIVAHVDSLLQEPVKILINSYPSEIHKEGDIRERIF